MKTNTPRNSINPLYAPRKVAFAILCVGTTKGHDLINQGRIRAVKLDGKTLVDLESIEAFLASLPAIRASRRDIGGRQDGSP